MNRRIISLLVLVFVMLAALLGFFLYLTGGQAEQSAEKPKAASGLVPVKTIYTANGENIRRPTGIGAADNGDFYVTLKDNARVFGFDRRGDAKAAWGKSGLKRGQFLAPLGVAVNRLQNRVYVVDRARLRLICFDTKGKFQWERPVLNPTNVMVADDEIVITTFGPIVRMSLDGEPISESGSRGFEEGLFDYPRAAVAVEKDTVIADTNNTRVQRVSLSGDATAVVKWSLGSPPRFQDDPDTIFGVPSGITKDAKGRVFVLDGFRYEIRVLDPKSGKTLHTFKDLEGDVPGMFRLPTGIAFLGGDTFAITDTFNDRVQIVRLLLPEENNVVKRNPWLWYLLLLLLPLLLLPLFRRRVFATREMLDRAAGDENVRLLVAAFRKVHLLPEVASDYSTYAEKDVDLGQYFEAVGETADSEHDTEETRLGEASTPRGWRLLLAPRRLLLAADAEQAERMAKLSSAKVQDYDWMVDEYRID